MMIFKKARGVVRRNTIPVVAIVAIAIAAFILSSMAGAQNDPTANQAKVIEPITVQPPTTQPTTVLSTTQPPTTVPSTTQPPTTEPPTTQAPTTEPPTTQAPEVYEDDYDDNNSYGEYLGMFTLTAYCPCYQCSEGYGNGTASGTICTEGRTVACNVLPFGTHIYIEGYGEYIVEDRGGGLGSSTIDVYFDEHRGNFKDYRAVYILD